jgi:hypothetical protein
LGIKNTDIDVYYLLIIQIDTGMMHIPSSAIVAGDGMMAEGLNPTTDSAFKFS